MRKSRAKFKLALRYCREHVDEMKADACANAVFDKDAKRFWHEAYKLSNVKATANVSTIAGKVGDRQIVDMWKQYYEQLYCAKYDNVTMSVGVERRLWSQIID